MFSTTISLSHCDLRALLALPFVRGLNKRVYFQSKPDRRNQSHWLSARRPSGVGGQMKVWAIPLLMLLITGCSSIEQQSRISTPVGQTSTAGVGDVVLRVEGRESMPNAFGKADIFGRTRPTGFTTIQYGGMQGDKVILLRSAVATQSDATTMNSTPLILPTQQNTHMNGNVGSTPFSGTATTTGSIYIPPTGSTSVNSQLPTVPILVDWHSQPRVPSAGKTIVIQQATPTSLVYRVE